MHYNQNVFINCPFDKRYQVFEDVIVFTIMCCGFKPRSAKESSASSNRILKIQQIIRECHFAVHDISRTELDKKTKLPRFNMPFELGLFIGAQFFGENPHQKKSCLIFDKSWHRFEKFISDIKGHDIVSHNNEPAAMIGPIRDCLAEISRDQQVASKKEIYRYYIAFKKEFRRNKIGRKNLSFGENMFCVFKFLKRLSQSEGGVYVKE